MRKILTWKTIDLDGHPIETSVTPAETTALQILAAGQNVLEIGAAYGYSSIQMAKTALHVTSIDPHAGELPGSYEKMSANLVLHGVTDKVTIVREFSQDAFMHPFVYQSRYSLVFVDGCHHSPEVDNDVHESLRLLAPGGFIAVHDYYEYDFPDIARVLDALPFKPTKIVDTLWLGRPSAS